MRTRAMLPYLVLLGGVLVVSTASILIRVAQGAGMSSLIIAAGRLGFAALLLTPIAWARAGDELRHLGARERWLGILSGGLLAIHFASWISSLAYTSVASSVALVTTNPLWVGLATFFIFRERLSKPAVAGIVLTFLGTILIGYSDSQQSSGSNPMLGNSLALLGAITVSGYFLIGRTLRRTLSILAYIWIVYTSAAIVLVVVALISGQRFWGFSPIVYLALLGLAIGPQLLGHTSFNWALKYLSATFIAVSILGEPVGSALLAFAFLGESFAPIQLGGFVVLLSGIVVAALGERVKAPTATAQAPVASEQVA